MTDIICESDRLFYVAVEAMVILSRRLIEQEDPTLTAFVERFQSACGVYWICSGDSRVEVQLCGLEERIRQSPDYAIEEIRQAITAWYGHVDDLSRLELVTNMLEILDGMETALLVTGLILRPIEV